MEPGTCPFLYGQDTSHNSSGGTTSRNRDSSDN